MISPQLLSAIAYIIRDKSRSLTHHAPCRQVDIVLARAKLATPVLRDAAYRPNV